MDGEEADTESNISGMLFCLLGFYRLARFIGLRPHNAWNWSDICWSFKEREWKKRFPLHTESIETFWLGLLFISIYFCCTDYAFVGLAQAKDIKAVWVVSCRSSLWSTTLWHPNFYIPVPSPRVEHTMQSPSTGKVLAAVHELQRGLNVDSRVGSFQNFRLCQFCSLSAYFFVIFNCRMIFNVHSVFTGPTLLTCAVYSLVPRV